MKAKSLNQKRIRSVQVLAAQVQHTQAAAVHVVKASSLSHLNVSGSWGGSTGLIHSKVVCFVVCVQNMINDRLIVAFGTQSPAREFDYKALLLMSNVLPTEIQSVWRHYCLPMGVLLVLLIPLFLPKAWSRPFPAYSFFLNREFHTQLIMNLYWI